VAHPQASLRRAVPVYYYLFDLLYSSELLRSALGFGGPLRYTEHRERDGEAFWAQACRDGWEGLIAKRADAPYQGGRSRDWLKFKCENAQEFVIGGYTDPQRSRVGFGALLLGYHNPGGDLVYAGKVGTGFNTQMLRSLHDRLAKLERSQPPFGQGRLPSRRGVHWVEPRLVGQIAFTEWTDDGQLRHPRFQGLRGKPGRAARPGPGTVSGGSGRRRPRPGRRPHRRVPAGP
jgi:ATP-dependent DNA ligase